MVSFRTAAVAFSICLAGVLVYAAEPDKKEVITSVGKQSVSNGKLMISVAEEKGDLVFQLVRAVSGGKATEILNPKLKAKGAVWAVYPENADRVWVFYADSLYRWEFEENPTGHRSSGKVFTGDEAIKNAPEKLLKALPGEHVQKLKGK
jgi:predicted methyltransferase